jgi:hypothetical protein
MNPAIDSLEGAVFAARAVRGALIGNPGSTKDFSLSVIPRDWRTFDDPPSSSGLARL